MNILNNGYKMKCLCKILVNFNLLIYLEYNIEVCLIPVHMFSASETPVPRFLD